MQSKAYSKVCISDLDDWEKNFSVLRRFMELANVSFSILHGIDHLDANRCKLLILGSKKGYKYLSLEIKSLIDYLVGGGSLIVLMDPKIDCTFLSNVREIVEVLGIYPRCVYVKTASGERVIKIKISDSEHKLLKEVKEIYYPYGSSFLVKKRPFTKVILKAPKNTSAAVAPIVVSTRYGNGKVVVIGTNEIFNDKWILKGDNLRLFLNMINWLLDMRISDEIIDVLKGTAVEKEVPERPKIEVKRVASKPKAIVQEVLEKPIEIKRIDAKRASEIMEKKKVEHIKEEPIIHREIQPGFIKETIDLDAKIRPLVSRLESMESKIISLISLLSSMNTSLNGMAKKIEHIESEILDALKENNNLTATMLNILRKLEEFIKSKLGE